VFTRGRARDAETDRARSQVHRFVEGPRDLPGWVDAIRESDVDALIYPEVGMDAMTTRLAALRLARFQAAAWGHPETTGLPTIDAYLSAQAFEPDAAQSHYTERLVALPNLGVSYEPLQALAATAPAIDVDHVEHLLLCPGAPFKYLPQHDPVWVEIARRMERGRLAFFAGGHEAMTRQFHERLRRAFMRGDVDYDRRVVVLPRMRRDQFFGLMRSAGALLDTLGFSGFNTAIQAIECGLPVVAFEGEFMRGRLASGIVRRLGLDECVATTEQAFIDIAARLAGDDGQRLALRRQIELRRSVLFNDVEPVRSLERLLEEAAR
jgi:protein O-GlcNAc transferase